MSENITDKKIEEVSTKKTDLPYLSVGSLKEMLKDYSDEKEVRIISESGMAWKLNKKRMSLQQIKGDKEKFTIYIK